MDLVQDLLDDVRLSDGRFGSQVLMLYATALFGGKFFHNLAWTPNLLARLGELGVEPERLRIPESKTSAPAEK